MRDTRKPRRQSGSTLIVSLIMLTLLTLFVISAINSGTINLRIAGNTQAQDEARAAAQQAIEDMVSSIANFYPTPLAAHTMTKSINNDTSTNTGNYAVAVTRPVCKGATQEVGAAVKTVDCANGAKAGLFCWDTLWEVSATATRGGTTQTVTQGVLISFPPSFIPSTVGC
jgi:Tfp pilus assembly protein PilX